jgi:hypothetical protein
MGSPVLLSDPNGARYQAAPHPENSYRLATSDDEWDYADETAFSPILS